MRQVRIRVRVIVRRKKGGRATASRIPPWFRTLKVSVGRESKIRGPEFRGHGQSINGEFDTGS
jgi:hypothetical protein